MNWINHISQDRFSDIYKRISYFLTYPMWYVYSVIMLLISTASMFTCVYMGVCKKTLISQILMYVFLLIDLLMIHTSKGTGTYEFYLNHSAYKFVNKINGKILFSIIFVLAMIGISAYNIFHNFSGLSVLNMIMHCFKYSIYNQTILRLFVYMSDFYYLVMHNKSSMSEYRLGNVLRFTTVKNTVEVYVYENGHDVLLHTFHKNTKHHINHK